MLHVHVSVCVSVLDSFSVLRAHKLRLRLPSGVLSVPDMPRDDRPRQHVSKLYL